MALEGDAIGVLHWLDRQAKASPGATLWDSDVMRTFEWDVQQTQAVLRCLEKDGCITAHPVALSGQAYSLGYLRVSRKGQQRLADPLAYTRRSVIRERLRHPLTA
jgi:hypothetical protein